MAELWLYLDAVTGQQKGPVPAPIVKKLLRKGIVQPQQLDPLDPGKEAARTGPVTTQQLVKLFMDGEADGMTLVWNQELNDWKPIGEVPSLREFLQETNDDLDRETELKEQATDVPIEHQVFENTSTNALVAEDGREYVYDAESKTYVTPEDKIEEELASLQQAMNEEKAKENDTAEEKKKTDKWKKSKKNTWVYMNGLPLDVTVQEVHDHFAKCGVIQPDIVTGKPRIKLYQNKETGGLNGDGSVCYMKEASVELAVQLLDKSQIRPDWPIDVSPAVFQQKEGVFVKRKKLKIDTRAKIKMFEKEKALSWNEGEVNEPAGLRIVVIKHMFTPAEIEDEAYEKELQEDIHDECLKIGEDGVVVIKFASSGSAARCIEIMNGRFFAGRQLECGFWDGTDYTHRESTNEEKERADKFQEWLEDGSSSESEAEEEKPGVGKEKAVSGGEGVHLGREMPDNSDDSDVESDGDAAEGGTGADEVHAGRAMPDLDDLDDE
eukprot:jgi/Phyca11/526311/estExt2_fgenesh1_pm.C_PHYCAscaffold_90028